MFVTFSRSLGLLVRKVEQGSVEALVHALGEQVTHGKDSQEKEIAGLGLRAVVADLPNGPVAVNMAKKLTPSLLAGLVSQVCFSYYVPPPPSLLCLATAQSGLD